MTNTYLGYIILAIFVLAYALAIAEERLKVAKSVPMILAAGLIWLLISTLAESRGVPPEDVRVALHHYHEEYGSLFLFLLVAMTYVNVIAERGVFRAFRAKLINLQFGYKSIFWLTGALAFVISPLADNLTTALTLGAVVVAVGERRRDFVVLASINVVVAANAGGAFSPFGDLTTLMIWQAGKAQAADFLQLFIPSLVNFLVPAFIMSMRVPAGRPEMTAEPVQLKPGAAVVCALFLLTVVTAIGFEQLFHLPPFMGMMTGLGYLFLYASLSARNKRCAGVEDSPPNIFKEVANAEWDTLLFFFGIMFCIGGLAYLGYIDVLAQSAYGGLGPSVSNVLAGVISAVVDNIPVMFGILSMNPEMDCFQWLLVTLTAGVGGSLLSVGSAAGVALMGQSQGQYTFFSHLKWSWAIALGYAASIYAHFLLNGP